MKSSVSKLALKAFYSVLFCSVLSNKRKGGKERKETNALNCAVGQLLCGVKCFLKRKEPRRK